MTNKPFIYLFQAIGQFYFYDVNKNQVLLIDKDVFDFLSEQQVSGSSATGNTEVTKTIEKLKSKGYLSSKHSLIIEHPLTEYCNDYLRAYMANITLQVTQSCNLRCRYCAYSGDGSLNRKHQLKSMSMETARKSIEFLAEHSKEVDTVSIGFYGGEPLLEFELIKECVSYSRRLMPDKKIEYLVTTNATVINDEILKFLEDNKVAVTVSIDGPQEIHDRYRRYAGNGEGTYQSVIKNIRRIRDEYPGLYKHISINAVADLGDDLNKTEEFFKNNEVLNELPVQINPVSDNYIDFNYIETTEHIVSEEELLFKQLVDKIRGKNSKLKSQYINSMVSFSTQLYETEELPEKIHHQGPCMPGQNKLFVDIDGVIRPCEKVGELCEPMKLGTVYDGIDYQKVKNLLNIGKLTEDECLNCWAIRLCKQCALFADDTTSLCKNRKTQECRNQYYLLKELLKSYVAFKTLGIM